MGGIGAARPFSGTIANVAFWSTCSLPLSDSNKVMSSFDCQARIVVGDEPHLAGYWPIVGVSHPGVDLSPMHVHGYLRTMQPTRSKSSAVALLPLFRALS